MPTGWTDGEDRYMEESRGESKDDRPAEPEEEETMHCDHARGECREGALGLPCDEPEEPPR